jgi:3-methyladenine DNA glycosylase AlkD
MELNTLMTELQSMGTAQNVKVYKRHGAKEPLFGVSFANLGKLKKKIKLNTPLARKLWQTRNCDARTLACMIADPKELSSKELDTWVLEVDYTTLAGYFGGLVARSAFTLKKIDAWIHSEQEFIKDCGYSSICQTLKESSEKLTDDYCLKVLVLIENGIHLAPNRAKQAMNNVLMSIGIYKENCRKPALATAKRVGKVEVDHGDTSCKTPDAVAYIQKAVKRLEERRKRK